MSKEKKKEDADMKMVKKLATLLLTICLVVPCFSMISLAADGKIMFTDPSTKVGEALEVTGVVSKTSGNFGKIEIVMTYDTSHLKFKSGDGIVEGTAGEITYTGDATNETGSRKEFKIIFDVLKAGTTKITIKNSTVKNVSGTVLNYTNGSSTITIAEGEVTPDVPPTTTPDETTDSIVDINGELYSISNSIPENEIPKGYEAATLDYDMVTYKAVRSEEFSLSLVYLVGADGEGAFYMYREEDATFVPYEEIEITDNVRIVLLSDVSGIELPERYVKKEVVAKSGAEFPAWQDKENPDFFVLYAVSNSGAKGLYQLDNEEGTYQRFISPEVEDNGISNTFIGKLSNLLQNHLDYVILGTGLGFILFVIIIVILSVKLYNRNAELDEIYDEYGIDDEEDDDESDDDEDEYEDDFEEDEEGNKEMEMLVQAGMMEVFPEEIAEEGAKEEVVEEPMNTVIEEPVQEVTVNTVEIPIEKVVEKMTEKEDTLGAALAKQKEAAKEEQDDFFDEDDDILDNFSMDFIDLDD